MGSNRDVIATFSHNDATYSISCDDTATTAATGPFVVHDHSGHQICALGIDEGSMHLPNGALPALDADHNTLITYARSAIDLIAARREHLIVEGDDQGDR